MKNRELRVLGSKKTTQLFGTFRLILDYGTHIGRGVTDCELIRQASENQVNNACAVIDTCFLNPEQ